jgi:dTDP-4-dehydrorhamnose 3,5-epimerase
MKFTELRLAGAFVIDIEPHNDARGFFARTFCAREFEMQGLVASFAQCSTSYNATRGTLRGMHFQLSPHDETKLVRCTAGAIVDVIVDIRAASPTYGKSHSVELSRTNHRMLYVPQGFAHGFQTLEDGSEVLYQISVEYVPEASRGLRWNDPDLSLPWPIVDNVTIAARDQSLPTLRELERAGSI